MFVVEILEYVEKWKQEIKYPKFRHPITIISNLLVHSWPLNYVRIRDTNPLHSWKSEYNFFF